MVPESMTPTELHDEARRLQLAGLSSEAEAAFLKLLESEPGRADVLTQLAMISMTRGDLQEAEVRAARAADLDGSQAEVWNILGAVKAGQGDLKAAVSQWRKALECAPESAPQAAIVHGNLGKALAQLGEPDAARQHFHEAIKVENADWTHRVALATLLASEGKETEAVEVLRVHTGPEPELWLTLGRLEALRGRFAEAEVAYLAALRSAPHHPEGHTGLANLFLAAGSPGQALDAAERVLFAHPEHTGARTALARALAALGRIEEAVDAFATVANQELHIAELHHRVLDLLRLDPRQNETTIADAHVRWGRLVAAAVGRAQVTPAITNRDPERVLKVGYLSTDFLRTPGSHVLGACLASHDPAQVEVSGYADVPVPDETTKALAARCARFRNLAGLSDQEAAELIRQDGLDILVDLGGHAPGGRPGIFAFTPAPLQIAGPGYDCTRGLAALTHRLSDAATDPLGAEGYGPESILRLDRPAFAYLPFPEAAEAGSLPALANGFLTFGYFGPLERLNDNILEAWAALLRALPGSRLSLHGLPADPRTRASWLDRFETAGLDLDRIGFRVAPEGLEGHLAAFGTVDVALAEFPQPDAASLCEALWMGLPVLGVERRTHAFRPGHGVLAPLGLDGWMAGSAAGLVEEGRRLATDLPALAELRRSLRGRMQASQLLDGPGLGRALDATYRALWASALS